MALLNIIKPSSQVQNSQGAPLAGGQVYMYEPGTTTFITSYKDSGLVVPNASPVGLSSSGRANIWITRDCDMFIYDRNGNLVLQELNANPDALSTDQQGGLVPNGSFEIDTDANTVPDGWTLVSSAGSSNARDNTTSTDGAYSFRFTSSGVGGGSLTTIDFFPVTDVVNLQVSFDIKGSVLGPNNRVRVEWYDISFVSISNTDAYNATNTPTSWTNFGLSVAPPVGARFAKLRLIGIDPSVPFAASTWFDRINVFYAAIVSGVFNNITIAGNSIISTNTNGAINIVPNGTGNLRLGTGSLEWPKYSADAAGVVVSVEKSRNATDGLQTIVQDADELGTIRFQGSDGTAFRDSSAIVAQVDGTPGASDMPGRLVFKTSTDGAATLVERMRVTNYGSLHITGDAETYQEQSKAMLVLAGTTNLVQNVAAELYRFRNDVNGAPLISLAKSRGATVGAQVIVGSSDTLGDITFRGSDGVSFKNAARISAFVDGTPGVNDMPGRLVFSTTLDGASTTTERMRISNLGKVWISANGMAFGTPILTISGNTPSFALQSDNDATNINVSRFSADNLQPYMTFVKSRGATLGTATVVAASDPLGTIGFYGADGTAAREAANITVVVDATPGASDMPGRMVFNTTTDGVSTASEAMRISQNGQVVISAKPTAYGVPPTFSGTAASFVVQAGTAAGIANTRYSADAGAALLFLGKSRSATYGGQTVVALDDLVGSISFRGSDGTAMIGLATISGAVDATPGTNDMPGRLVFQTTPDGASAPLERVRIGQTGQVVITGNGSTYVAPATHAAVAPLLALQSSTGYVTLDQFSTAGGDSVRVAFRKSKNATLGSHTIVANGDFLGQIDFMGSNGTAFQDGASIQVNVDSAPGASNDMPTRMTFWTSPDGTATPVERMRITQAGIVRAWEPGQSIVRNVKVIAPGAGADTNAGNLDIYGYLTSTQASTITGLVDITPISNISNLDVNTNYSFEIELEVSATSTGGAKVGFTFSQTPINSGYLGEFIGPVVATTQTWQVMTTAVGVNSSGAGLFLIRLCGHFKTHATLATTFAVQFAQNSAVGTSTLQIGSFARITKLGL